MIPAKKSLGQNWLTSKVALGAIVDAGDIHADDLVLEVGPGRGALTELLLKLAGKVIAIEKDHRLIPELKERFSTEIANKKLDLVEQDVLDFDPVVLGFYKQPYKLIANIPYYITGQIFRKFLETKNRPELIILLVQKEVAERIVARNKKESILSLSVKFFGQPKIVAKVPRTSFQPAPKVDSAILLIEKIGNQNERVVPAKKFFEILHRGFAHPRKNIKNNLGEGAWRLEKCKISPTKRPADLTLDQWLCLAGAQK